MTEFDTHVSENDAAVLEQSLKPRKDDVLLSVKGTIGSVALMPANFQRVVLDRNLALLRCRALLWPSWLAWCLRSTRIQDQMQLSSVFAAQPGLPLVAIRELRLPLPGIAEQQQRASRADSLSSEVALIRQRIDHQLELLAERRQALITAAVTGQIDVATARGAAV